MNKLIGVAALAVIPFIAACGDGAGGGEVDPTTTPAPATTTERVTTTTERPNRNDPGISATEFAALRIGMGGLEVQRIVGSSGELVSQAGSDEYRTVIYTWSGEEGTSLGASATVMFQGGELVSKAQFGL